jgi:hypothetical protein
MQRADDAANQPVPTSGSYADVAQDANVAYDSSLGGSAFIGSMSRAAAPSGLPSSAPLTPFERKMRQRARKKRREERWSRWFGKASPEQGENGKR